MLAASGLLFYEAVSGGIVETAVGAVVGISFVAIASRVLSARKDVHFGMLGGADARRALLLVGVMTVHSFAEGVGVGVSFGDGDSLGLVTALAIAVHNIPEGLAISLVLVPRGIGVLRAAGWSIVSSLPQPLVAVPAFLFVTTFSALLPAGLGFAGGAMLWMVAAQMVPTPSTPHRVAPSRCRSGSPRLRSRSSRPCSWPPDTDSRRPQRARR